jgi:hypothetical protein
LGDFNTTVAQTEDNGSEKTVVFNTFIIRLGGNATLSGFEGDRQEIKGTNDQLINQFPEVLEKFENISDREIAEVNATVGNVTFIDRVGTNESAVAIPYANVTEQTYTDEFKSLLQHMDRSGLVVASSCWEVIVVPPEDPGTWVATPVHVTKCWGPA